MGLGPEWEGNTGQTRQEPCAEGYVLESYRGEIIQDGVAAMVDTILGSDETVTVIAIGPLPTVGEALHREPRIAENARFVGMHGSLRKGHKRDRDRVIAEANVVNNPESAQAVFRAPWDVTITPLDTCGIVQLEGEKHATVLDSGDPLAKVVMDHYQVWWQRGKVDNPDLWRRQSSILFDTVAVYLAFSNALCVMEDLPIRVTDDGYTLEDEGGRPTRCATDWRDLGAFEDLLVDRLTNA